VVEHDVDHAVLQRLGGREPPVAVEVLDDPLLWLWRSA
jgi:hypothetical protein